MLRYDALCVSVGVSFMLTVFECASIACIVLHRYTRNALMIQWSSAMMYLSESCSLYIRFAAVTLIECVDHSYSSEWPRLRPRVTCAASHRMMLTIVLWTWSPLPNAECWDSQWRIIAAAMTHVFRTPLLLFRSPTLLVRIPTKSQHYHDTRVQNPATTVQNPNTTSQNSNTTSQNPDKIIVKIRIRLVNFSTVHNY